MKRQSITKHSKWNLGHNMQYNVKQNKKYRLLRSKRKVICFLYAMRTTLSLSLSLSKILSLFIPIRDNVYPKKIKIIKVFFHKLL